jgi:beta-lactamase class C
VFRLASLSKGVTAATAGLAVQAGFVRWDTPVHTYVPHAMLATPQATDGLTLYTLLSQQTGLARYGVGDRSLEAGMTVDKIYPQLGHAKLKCMPGQCYSYQNVAFQWAADLIATTTQQPFERFASGRLFVPLGMNTASFGLEALRHSASWAKPHVGRAPALRVVDPLPSYYQLPAAAGVNASITDLSRWLAAQGGHRPDVLPPALLAAMHAPRVAVPPYSSGWRRTHVQQQWYGLGWRVWNYRGHRVITHSGAVQGYRSVLALVPEKDLGLAVVWNSQSSAPGKLLPLVLDSALGLGDPATPMVAAPSH